eukprot:g5519.t1
MKVVQQILLCAVMSSSPGASSQELPDHGPSTWHQVSHRLEPAQRQELPPCDAAVLSCDASRLANDSSTCLISGEQTGSFYIRRSCQLQFNGSIVFEDAMVEAAWPEVTLQIRAQNGNVTLRDSFFWRFSKLGFHSAWASATASISGGIFFQWDAPSGEVQKFLTVAETVLSVEPPGRWDIVLNGSRRVEFRGMQRLTLQHARDVFLASRMLVNVFDALHISANRSISTASALYCSGKIVVDGLNVAEVQLGGLVGGDLVSDGAHKPVVLVRGSAVAIAPADTWNVERIAVFASKQSTFRAVSDYYDTDVRTTGDRFMEACDAEADAESRHRRPPEERGAAEDPRRAAVQHYFPWSRGATTTAAATRQASERSSPAARQHQQASPLRDDFHFPRDSIDYCQMWSSPCASSGSGADNSGGRSSRRVEINQRLQNENEDAPEGSSTTGNATSTCYTPTWYGDFFGDAERFPHGLADLERQFVNQYSFDFIQVAPVVQIAAKAKIQAQAMLFCADRWQVTKSTLSTSGRGCRAGQGRGRGASGRDPHLLGAGGSHSGRGGFAVRADSDAVQRVASAGMQYDIPDSEDARGSTQKKKIMFSDLVHKKNFFVQDSRKSGGIWWDVSAPASAGGCGDDTECSFLWRRPSRPSFGGGMIWASVRDAQLEKAALQADGSKGMVSEGTYGQSWASGGGSGGQIVLHTLNGVLDGSSGLLSAKGGSNACLATGASGAGGGGLVGIRWHQQRKQERTGRTTKGPRPLKTVTAHIQIAVDGGSIDPSCLENPPPHVHTVTERIQGHRGIASHLGMCSPGLSGTFCTPCEKGTWSGGGASCEPCDQPGGVEKFEWIAVGWTNSTCPYRCPVGYPNVDTNPSCLDPWRFTMAFFGGLFGLLTIGVVLVFLILISMSAEEYRRKRRKRQQRAAYRAEQMLLEVAAPGGSSTAEAGRGGPTTAVGLGGTTHQVRENPLGDTPTTGRFESLPRRYSPSGSSYGGRRGGIAGATAGKRKMMSFGYANNEVADRRSMARWAEIRVNVWMSATTRDVPGAVRGRGGPPRGGSASPTATDSFLGEFCPCSSYLRQVASGFRGIVRWCGRAFRRACAAVRSCGERVCLCCCKLRSRGVFRRNFRESRAGGPAEARSRREPGEHAVSSRRAADDTPPINDHDPWFSENHDESTHDPSIAKDVDACSSVPTSQRGSTISLPLSPAEAGSPGPLTRVLNDNLTDAHAFLSAFGHQYHLHEEHTVEPNWFPEAPLAVHPLPHSGSSEAGAAGRRAPLLGSGSPGVVASPMLTVIPPAQSPLTTEPSGTLSLPPLAAGTSTAATPTDQLGGRGTTYGGRGPLGLGLNYSTSRYLGPGGSSFMPPPSTCTSASAMLTPTEHASPEQIGSASATASANNITNQVFLTEDAVRSLLFSPDDLPYHARRVYFRGTNREQDPWRLEWRNPWRARVSDDGWRAFSEKVNTEVCVSTSSAVRVGKFLSAVYPPLVPWWRRKHRRARACRLLEFVNIELENLSLGQRLWSDVSARTSDRNLQIKFGCDGSASLAYLDFLDYDSNSLFDWSPELRENEQRFLPAAGDGSYDAPFALELTDPLLSQMQSVAGSAVLLPLLHAFNRCARAISAEDLDAAWRAYWKASSAASAGARSAEEMGRQDTTTAMQRGENTRWRTWTPMRSSGCCARAKKAHKRRRTFITNIAAHQRSKSKTIASISVLPLQLRGHGCGSTSRSSASEAGVTHDLFRTTNNGVSFNMLPGATARPSSAIASAEGRGAHLAAQLRVPSSASIMGEEDRRNDVGSTSERAHLPAARTFVQRACTRVRRHPIVRQGKQHACHLAQILQKSVAFPREQILQNRTAPSWSYSPSLLILALYALIFADAMVSILLANTFFQMHPVVFLVWFLLPPLCPLAYPVQGIGWLLFARDEKGRTFCHLVAASMGNVYAGFTAWLLSVVVRSLGLLTPGGAGGGDEDGELVVAVALPARLYRGVVGLFAETTPSPILTDTIADADNPFVGLRHTLLGALCFLAELGGIAVLKIALGVTANFYIGAVETEELQFDERDEEEPRRTGANFGRNMISNMNYEAGDSGDEHESRAAAARGDGAGSR